jgi:hypothetical protein
MEKRNSSEQPKQLIGDSLEARNTQAANVAYAVLTEHSGANRYGNVHVAKKDFSAVIGSDADGYRYLSYMLNGSQGTEHRLDIDLPSSGEELTVSVLNSFAVGEGNRLLPNPSVVTRTDVLRLMDPSDLGTRGDLRDNKEVGLRAPDFPDVFFSALPALNQLEDGDIIDIGGLRKNELTVAKFTDGDNIFLTFVDSGDVSRLEIQLFRKGGVLKKVSFIESDQLPIDNGFVDYRGGTAIDSLAAKVVSKLSVPEKKAKEEKPRSSFKDKLKRLFTSATAGYSDFGGSGSGWKKEQLNAESPKVRDFRESVEYLESILKRPEVKTGLETNHLISIEVEQGELVVIKTNNPSEFVDNFPETGELVAVSAGAGDELCFVGHIEVDDGDEVVVIGRTVTDGVYDSERLAESLILTKESSGQVSTAYSSKERSPRVTAYGKGKIAPRVLGFLKKFL